MNARIRVLLLALASLQLAGCLAVVAGGAAATGLAIHDRRSFGTIIDDQTLEVRVRDAIHDDPAFTRDHRIKVDAFRGWVLLAGEAGTEANVRLAGEITAGVDGVRRVVNELAPERRPSFGQSSSDRWIATKVKTALTGVDLEGFDPTRVQVTTARSVVYLMGLVSRDEGRAATEQARTVRGVDRVVTIFEYQEDQPEVVEG